jgi:cytochrome c biogenesis protein ResB
VTKSLQLIRPAVVVRVLRGSVELGGATLARGDRFDFEGMKIGFPEIRYWGEFSIVRDPGAPVVFAGYLIGLLGLLLKLRGSRSEVEWQTAREGGAALRGWGAKKPALFRESRSP